MTHPVNLPPPDPDRRNLARLYLIAVTVALLPLGLLLIFAGVVGPAPDTVKDAGYTIRPATEVELLRHQMDELHLDMDLHAGVKR